MAIDVRRRILRHAVTELMLFETELEATLRQEQQAVRGHPDAAGAIERFAPTVQAQRDRLAAYIKSLGPESAGGTPSAGFTFSSAATASGTLRQINVALNYGAVSYGMLYEMALRLYEPPLREIAPKHLKAYADAALTMTRLVPAVVAWELSRDALHCSCICPMCGLGACACVALGTQTLVAAWREVESWSAGFALQSPKPDSELARAGVHGGERLLAIDGQEVRALPDMQAAIRKHALGEEVRFLVQRGSEPPREVAVRHVSDYPKT
jgi:membrane-associated protease RseP (regulator of RpoE activity)